MVQCMLVNVATGFCSVPRHAKRQAVQGYGLTSNVLGHAQYLRCNAQGGSKFPDSDPPRCTNLLSCPWVVCVDCVLADGSEQRAARIPVSPCPRRAFRTIGRAL